jgi:membrane protein
MGDAAASLTYYALLSLLPLVVVATSLFSLFGNPGTVSEFVNYLADRGADPTTANTVEDVMRTVTKSSNGAAVGLLIVSVIVSLNSASSAFAAAGRALNIVTEADEQRGFVRRRLTNIGMALAVALLLGIVVVTILLGEGLAHDLLKYVGLEGFASDIWLVVRMPVAIGCAIYAYALIYAYAPDRKTEQPRITVGTLVGVSAWIVASIGFAYYLRHFSSYGAAYGAFGTVIVLLIWTWLSCCTLLIGAQIDFLRKNPEPPHETVRKV